MNGKFGLKTQKMCKYWQVLYICPINTDTKGGPFGCKGELPWAQPCWFALYRWRAEKGWLKTYSTLLPHTPTLFTLLQTQTARHKTTVHTARERLAQDILYTSPRHAHLAHTIADRGCQTQKDSAYSRRKAGSRQTVHFCHTSPPCSHYQRQRLPDTEWQRSQSQPHFCDFEMSIFNKLDQTMDLFSIPFLLIGPIILHHMESPLTPL